MLLVGYLILGLNLNIFYNFRFLCYFIRYRNVTDLVVILVVQSLSVELDEVSRVVLLVVLFLNLHSRYRPVFLGRFASHFDLVSIRI